MNTYTFIYFDKLLNKDVQLDINANTVNEAIDIFRNIEPEINFSII